jgi:hypothetical protein
MVESAPRCGGFRLPAWAFGRDDEGFADPSGQPHATERRLGQHRIHGGHLVADDAVVRWCRLGDDPIVRSPIHSAAQVFSGETVFDAMLDAGAAGREGDGVTVMADERADVRLRRGDAAGFVDDHCRLDALDDGSGG